MNSIQNSSKLVVLAFVLLIVAFGCKSRKKVATITDASAEKTKMEQEATLRKQKEDELKRREAEEKAKRDAESAMNEMKDTAPKFKLNQYFDAIANSGNLASANSSINEALGMFATPTAPVLIVISEENGKKDHDKPTTIKDYLNYLKDQKKNINDIGNIKVDGSGKITEVELRKTNKIN
jgi:hypothetical protein